VHWRGLAPIEGLELERPAMHPLPVLAFRNYILHVSNKFNVLLRRNNPALPLVRF
jgi:hypothetical protein